jgi:hypothetical protein
VPKRKPDDAFEEDEYDLLSDDYESDKENSEAEPAF